MIGRFADMSCIRRTYTSFLIALFKRVSVLASGGSGNKCPLASDLALDTIPHTVLQRTKIAYKVCFLLRRDIQK